MEATEKIRLLLQHWIDHNESHADEYRKWQATAADAGLAAAIAGAAEAMMGVNERLRQALSLVNGGEVVAGVETGAGHHAGHCHAEHDHGHEHHRHDHDGRCCHRDHCRHHDGHAHEHGHEHGHRHGHHHHD